MLCHVCVLAIPLCSPRPPVWEISEPEQDEGIQVDLQSTRRVSHSNIRASTASTLSGVSIGQAERAQVCIVEWLFYA